MLLISKGASVEASAKYGMTPIELIYKERSLTTQDEKLNEQKKTTTKMLIEKMSNVNQPIRSRGGMTALHHELRLRESNQDLSIIKLLIEKGANVNAKDGGGVTPLHLADTVEVATLFIAKGANVNTKDNEGRTPLHRVGNNRELASFLIKKGADVNAKSGHAGWSAVHLCAVRGSGNLDGLALLLAAGASPSVKSHQSHSLHGARTPLDCRPI